MKLLILILMLILSVLFFLLLQLLLLPFTPLLLNAVLVYNRNMTGCQVQQLADGCQRCRLVSSRACRDHPASQQQGMQRSPGQSAVEHAEITRPVSSRACRDHPASQQ